MNVPNLPFLAKKKQSEYFLSLVLRNEKASAVVFEEVMGKVNVVGEHVEPFRTTIEEATEEELLNVVDRAVSTAEKNLPEGVESNKTIFGVKEEWVEDGKIKKEYLGKLKKVSDELGFTPMGFLVIPEAIAHLLQKEEGAPISAVLAEIGRDNITLSLIKAGKIIESKSGKVVDSITSEVETLLKEFNTPEVFPPRIILFDGGKIELQQEFISHKWAKDSVFMHLPQVSNLPANFDARAVLSGAAKQMGFEVLEDSLIKAAKNDGDIPTVAIPINETPKEDKTLGEVASEFGFSTEDVKKDDDATDSEQKEDENEEEETKKPEKDEPLTAIADNFETKEDADLAQEFATIPEEIKIKDAEQKPLPVNAAMITTGLLGFLGTIKKLKIPSLIKGAISTPKKALFMIAPVGLIILYIIAYLFLRSATVTLSVDAKKSEQSVNITFSNTDKTNASDDVINAEFLTVSEDGKLSIATTGKKETGDKAKGTVTIFNNNSIGITLPAGTTITSENGDLNFTTDKAVTVASASGDIFSGTTPGKTDVPVTAETFGTSYNIPSISKFTVGGQSDVAAKNSNAFSGGTKKDIKVVAQADIDKLQNDIKKNLESKAKDEIQKKATGNSIVLPNFISETFDSKSFSKNVGEEATSVSITAVVVYEGVSYQRPEIVSFSQEKLKKDISSDLTIDEGSLDISATDLKKKEDQATAKIKIKADLIPKIDDKEIATKITGKGSADASSMLHDLPQVTDVKIDIFPNLFPQLLPFSSGKIKVVVSKNG